MHLAPDSMLMCSSFVCAKASQENGSDVAACMTSALLPSPHQPYRESNLAGDCAQEQQVY